MRQRPLQTYIQTEIMINIPKSSLEQGPTDALTSPQARRARLTSGEDGVLHVLVCITALLGYVFWLKGKPCRQEGDGSVMSPPS